MAEKLTNQALLLDIKEVKGTHGASLPIAMEVFLNEFYDEKFKL